MQIDFLRTIVHQKTNIEHAVVNGFVLEHATTHSSSNMILRNGILNNFFKELLIVLIRIKNLNYDVLQGLG